RATVQRLAPGPTVSRGEGLAYESHVVDLSLQQHHSPEYLRINPLGVVPTILHEGRPLHESGTICEYLDDVFPEPLLRPADPYDLARMRNWVRHVDGLIGNLIRFNWRHSIQKRAEKMTDAELSEMLARIPSAERRTAWLRVARQPYSEAELDESRAVLTGMVEQMEAMMTGGWLVGGAYSLADIAVAPFIRRIGEEIAPETLEPVHNPKVADWWAAVQARPAYVRADFGPFVAEG
ncbi:MAG TPA: glutathione S-transferase family protein, partial [Thalassobaculum sp.]